VLGVDGQPHAVPETFEHRACLAVTRARLLRVAARERSRAEVAEGEGRHQFLAGRSGRLEALAVARLRHRAVAPHLRHGPEVVERVGHPGPVRGGAVETQRLLEMPLGALEVAEQAQQVAEVAEGRRHRRGGAQVALDR